MKTFTFILAAGLAAASAKADQFTFSDVFADGTDITGSFTGTVVGDQIALAETPFLYENPNGFNSWITLYSADISVSVDGANLAGYYNKWFANGGLVPGSAGMMSFDGLENSFSLQNGPNAPGWSPFSYFSSVGGAISEGSYGLDPTEAINGSWKVVDQNAPPAVPDSGSTAVLLGLAMLTLMVGAGYVARSTWGSSG